MVIMKKKYLRRVKDMNLETLNKYLKALWDCHFGENDLVAVVMRSGTCGSIMHNAPDPRNNALTTGHNDIMDLYNAS